jgi:replicative DNA helicase Mcm
MTLTIEPALIDKAIASYTNLLELQIKDGKVTQIKKVKPPPPSPPTDIDLIITGKPKSLRDKLRAVLEVLEQLANQEGMVAKDTLMTELGQKGILPEEGNRLISVLLREGTIYEAKDGYLKKT